MVKRPWEVTFLGWGFIAVGLVSGVVHAWHAPPDTGLLLIELVEVWAIVAGAFLMTGKNWARWALIVWAALHVGVGAMHSWSMGVSHAVLAAAVIYALLREPAAGYFAGGPEPERGR